MSWSALYDPMTGEEVGLVGDPAWNAMDTYLSTLKGYDAFWELDLTVGPKFETEAVRFYDLVTLQRNEWVPLVIEAYKESLDREPTDIELEGTLRLSLGNPILDECTF